MKTPHKTAYETAHSLSRYVKFYSVFYPDAHQTLSTLIWLVFHDVRLVLIHNHCVKMIHKAVYEMAQPLSRYVKFYLFFFTLVLIK